MRTRAFLPVGHSFRTALKSRGVGSMRAILQRNRGDSQRALLTWERQGRDEPSGQSYAIWREEYHEPANPRLYVTSGLHSSICGRGADLTLIDASVDCGRWVELLDLEGDDNLR